MKSTIYRRRADGTLVGTPEQAAPSDSGASSVDPAIEPHVSRVPVTPLPDAFLPREESVAAQPVETPRVAPVPAAPEPVAPVAVAPIIQTFDETPSEFETETPAEPKKTREERKREKQLQREVKEQAKKFKHSPAGKILHRFFWILRIAVVAYIGLYIALGVSTSKALEKTNATPAHPVALTSGTNWLLVGSDSRRGLSSHMQHVLHTGPDTGSQRTDVIMIVHISKDGKPTLVSLPRDSYVTIPAHTTSDGTKVSTHHNKINAAYSFGGAPLLVATIEKNTGLHIDHYMEIGFAGIKDITDAVHGVTICVAHNYDDKNSGLHVKKGCQHMNGKRALAYVRMRYADPKGDIGRIQRQQQYMAAVLHKAATPGTLLNPLALKKLSVAGTSSVVVGSHDSVKDILKLAMAMRSISKGGGAVMTVPLSDTNAMTAAGSSVLWNKAEARKLFAQLAKN